MDKLKPRECLLEARGNVYKYGKDIFSQDNYIEGMEDKSFICIELVMNIGRKVTLSKRKVNKQIFLKYE